MITQRTMVAVDHSVTVKLDLMSHCKHQLLKEALNTARDKQTKRKGR